MTTDATFEHDIIIKFLMIVLNTSLIIDLIFQNQLQNLDMKEMYMKYC